MDCTASSKVLRSKNLRGIFFGSEGDQSRVSQGKVSRRYCHRVEGGREVEVGSENHI